MAQPVPGIGQLRAFAVDAEGAAAAVAGFTRPVLFIDRRILSVCSPEEVRAIAAHEAAHVRSGDNLKRLLLAATHGVNHPLVSWWRDAAERDADRFAASDARRAVALASALVKVARETQGSRLDSLAVSPVYDGGTIERRVRVLLADVRPAPARRKWRAALLILTALSVTPVAWKPLHAALEVTFHVLP
jgi:Zn-dependent protease with chaperone function